MKAFRPTAFEQETALALLAFREEGCDAVVLETGLGGRWDATNAVKKKILSVITKIGRDHCALLGDTLGEIAREKAAIIRGAAVTCPQEEGAAEVLYPLCRVCGEAKPLARSLAGQRFLYGGKSMRQNCSAHISSSTPRLRSKRRICCASRVCASRRRR